MQSAAADDQHINHIRLVFVLDWSIWPDIIALMGQNSTAKRILDRAGVPKQCALCGSELELWVEHANGDRRDNSLSNLRYLCKPCYMTIHTSVKSWKREDFSICSICGTQALCGVSLVSGTSMCPKCFRREFKQARPDYSLDEYGHAYHSFLATTPRREIWEPDDFTACSICGIQAVCGTSPISGTSMCSKCFLREFRQAHPDYSMTELGRAYQSFVATTRIGPADRQGLR